MIVDEEGDALGIPKEGVDQSEDPYQTCHLQGVHRSEDPCQAYNRCCQSARVDKKVLFYIFTSKKLLGLNWLSKTN